MIRDFLREVCTELKELNIEFVVVGGSAIENRGYDTGTYDLDFVLTTKGFSEIDGKIKGSSRFKVIDEISTMVGTEFWYENTWRTVEFITPRPFSGNKEPDEFIEYIQRYRSRRTDFGHVANPEVVFFMRLMIGDWEIYVQKIIRDIKAGLPLKTLDKVAAMSRTLGVEEKIEPRLERAREIIESRI